MTAVNPASAYPMSVTKHGFPSTFWHSHDQCHGARPLAGYLLAPQNVAC
jgi:hypothetical protein